MDYEKLNSTSSFAFGSTPQAASSRKLIVRIWTSLGVTIRNIWWLMVLWETDELPVNDIAKRLALETNTVTPLIQRMEREGIVNRTKGKVDTRQTIVSLTAHGKELREQSVGIPDCMLDILCGHGVKSHPSRKSSPCSTNSSTVSRSAKKQTKVCFFLRLICRPLGRRLSHCATR